MQKILTTTLLSLLLSNSYSYGLNTNNYLNNLSVDLAYGQLFTESHEYVYNDKNSKSLLSKIEWHIEDAPVLKSNISYNIPDLFNININGWHSISKTQGIMDDYDWLNPSSNNYSHWSTHSNTTLKKAHEIDLNINRNLIYKNIYNLELSPSVGYHKNHYDFVAKGGTAFYPEGVYIFNDDLKGISYQQTFATPYLGFNAGIGYSRFSTSLNYKYGLRLKSTDKDNHHLRNTTFETVNSNEDSGFAAVALKAKYLFNNNLELFGDIMAHKYADNRGEVTIKAPDLTIKYDNISGYDNFSTVLGTGFSYIF